MEIPQAVTKAFDVLADYYTVLIKAHHSDEDLLETINSHGVINRLRRPSSSASLVVAAMPCFLEFVPSSEETFLQSWTGVNTPYVLSITREHWHLFAEDKSLLQEYSLRNEVHKRFTHKRNTLNQRRPPLSGATE